MKSTRLRCITATTLFALAIPLRLAAQQQEEDKKEHPLYGIADLGTLGGTIGIANGINNKSWVTGDATLPGDVPQRAFLWRQGVMTDLGTLGGPNSASDWPVKDDKGLIAGYAETSTPDPLGEDFGGFGTNLITLGFVWKKGVMTPLPTLGGNNSGANGVNNRGQVVGVAEKNIQDPNCPPHQILDWGAVMWGPGKGEIQELPGLPGDTTAAAIGINDEGQVVGASGLCKRPHDRHALLWQHGSVTNLGSFGGTRNRANAINNRGQIVGNSELAGDTAQHAFFWRDGVMTDLGTLAGDSSSFAFGINNKGQVTGQSCNSDLSVCRAFLWQDGVMTDLNTLIPAGSPLFLIYGGDISDRGEIAGQAFDQITGAMPAFLATPCDENHADGEDCQNGSEATSVSRTQTTERPKVILPENVRKLLQQRPSERHGTSWR
jgi:probable HAF family extracellular repeat protein